MKLDSQKMNSDKEKPTKSEDEKFSEKVRDIFLQLTEEHDRHKQQLHRKTSDEPEKDQPN